MVDGTGEREGLRSIVHEVVSDWFGLGSAEVKEKALGELDFLLSQGQNDNVFTCNYQRLPLPASLKLDDFDFSVSNKSSFYTFLSQSNRA